MPATPRHSPTEPEPALSRPTDGPPEPDNQDGPTDAALLAEYRAGNEAAAATLHDRYVLRIVHLARGWIASDLQRRVEAEDVAQSVFRTFFRRAAAGQYDAPDQTELWQLLLTIALNKLRNSAAHHRAQKRHVGRTQELSGANEAVQSADCEPLVRLLIQDLLKPLSPDQQDIVRRRILGFSVEEIAQASQRSKRTVERTLQHFKQLLTQALSDDS